MCSFPSFLAYFGRFLPILPQIKTFFPKKSLSPRIILVLFAIFVPNLTFLGLLSPAVSFGEKKTVTHPDIQLAYIAIREP